MTTLLLALIVIQAASLLWSSVDLGDIFLQERKGAHLVRFLGIFALPVAISWFGRGDLDPNRLLCGWVDCIALAVSVAFVRLWTINHETEQFVRERELAAKAAAAAIEAESKAYEDERIRAATAMLEAHKAREEQEKPAAPLEQRHLATPKLRGGTRSARHSSTPKP